MKRIDSDSPLIRHVQVVGKNGRLTPAGNEHKAIYGAILLAPWFMVIQPTANDQEVTECQI